MALWVADVWNSIISSLINCMGPSHDFLLSVSFIVLHFKNLFLGETMNYKIQN